MMASTVVQSRRVGASAGPRILCCVFAAAVPFDAILVAQEGVSWLRLLGFLLIVVLAAEILVIGQVRWLGAVHFLPIALAVWATLSLGWSLGGPSHESALQIVQFSVMGALILAIPWSRRDIHAISMSIVAGGVLAAVMVLTRFGAGDHYLGLVDRASIAINTGTEQDPNHLAASLLLPLFLAAWLGWHRRGPIKLALISGAGTIAIAILLTGSRGAMVGLGLGLSAWVFGVGKRRMLRFVAAILLCIGVVLALQQVYPDVAERFTTTYTIADEGAGRLDIWAVGVTSFKLSPVWGVGVGRFPQSFERSFRATSGITNVKHLAVSHSLPLRIAVELGTLGLLLWSAWLLVLAALAFRSWNMRQVLVPFMIALTGASLFLDSFSERYWWLGMTMIALLSTCSRRSHSHDRASRLTGRSSAPLGGPEPAKEVLI